MEDWGSVKKCNYQPVISMATAASELYLSILVVTVT